MNGSFPIIPLLIVTSLIMLTLALFAWRKRHSGKAAIFLTLSMVGVALYNFGYAMELAVNTLPKVMFWVRFQNYGIFLIAPTWLLFAASVSGYEEHINLKLIFALSVIPIFLFLSAQTLGWLNLAHHNPHLETLGPYKVLAYDRNIFNYITLGYYSLCLAISTVLFAMLFFRAALSSRKQLSLYLLGSIPPWATMIVYNLNLLPSGLDLTPLFLGASALFFAFGFIKFRILDLIPLARNAIFEDMTNGVLIADSEDQIVDYNPALKAIFPEVGSSSKLSVGMLFEDYPSLKIWYEKKSEERVSFKKSTGKRPTYFLVSASDIIDRKQRVIGKIYSFYENTQEKLLLDKLERMAIHDGLTGIFNRQHFDQLANKELSRLQRYGGDLSMAMIDMDKFKKINDTYGHGAGDAALIRVAEILKASIRQSDLLARFGGEEFVILLPQTPLSAAQRFCERLQQLLEDNRVEYDSNQIEVKASFGITSIDDGLQISLEELYKFTDKALYQAKEAGGNTICIYDFNGDLF